MNSTEKYRATIICPEDKELILHFVDGKTRIFKGEYMGTILEYDGFLSFEYTENGTVEHNVNKSNLTYYSFKDTRKI